MSEREAQQLRDDAVRQGLETIRNRIDQFGVAETTIVKQGTNRILVENKAAYLSHRTQSVARIEFPSTNAAIICALCFVLNLFIVCPLKPYNAHYA